VLHISAVLPASRERRSDQNWIVLDCHKRFCQRVGSFVKLKTIIHHYTKLWRSSGFSLIPYSAKVFHRRLICLGSFQCYHLDSFLYACMQLGFMESNIEPSASILIALCTQD
jgi:hypothetical protein